MTLTPGPELTEIGSVVRHDDGALLLPGAEEATVGVGPYQLAWRRLRRNRSALIFGGLFILIVVACLLAPVYADHIAHTGPNVNHISEVITVGGHQKDVVSLTGTPIGPTWHSHFFFGADANGRDVAVRLLYGGRNSLEISALATIITIGIGTIVALVAGYFGGWADNVLSRLLDLIWAYPVLLLGVALGVSLSISGLDLGLFTLKGGSDIVPALIIGVVYIPYVARPIRGEVLSLRNREFVDAARALGAGRLRIMFSEILHRPATGPVHHPGGLPLLPRSRGAGAQLVVGDHAAERGVAARDRPPPDRGAGRDAGAGRAVGQHRGRRPAPGPRPPGPGDHQVTARLPTTAGDR
jgi:peptide/nickel transport system permease protein